MGEIHCLAALIFVHALADYPLQGDFLAKAKNPIAPIPGVPWWQAMTGHAVIQGGFVGLVTGSLLLGLAEAVAHWLIDYAKCRNWLDYNLDQIIHLLCKFLWIAILYRNAT